MRKSALEQTPKQQRNTRVMAEGQHPLTVSELYRSCLANEQAWTKLDLDSIRIDLTKTYLFAPIFASATAVEESSAIGAIDRSTELKITRGLLRGGKYRDLLELLRNAPGSRTRLFVIARWLKQEGICEPEDLIGTQELRRLAKKSFGFLSRSDFRYADTVRAWVPYFCRLLSDLRTRQKVSALVMLGYDKTAAQAAINKRSPVAAACEWLAARPQRPPTVDALRLKNAYSKIYGPERRARFSLCQG